MANGFHCVDSEIYLWGAMSRFYCRDEMLRGPTLHTTGWMGRHSIDAAADPEPSIPSPASVQELQDQDVIDSHTPLPGDGFRENRQVVH